MANKLRITRNREADDLFAHIRDDAAMMSALDSAVKEFWGHFKAEFASTGRSTCDPSPLLVLPTTDLLIALIERKVAALKTIPSLARTANELEALSKKASLYPVADDILQECLAEYRRISQCDQFELVNETTEVKKLWWQFW